MISLERTQHHVPGTNWSPVKHTATERRSIEVARSTTSDTGESQKTDTRVRDTEFDALDMLLLGSQGAHLEAQIESPFKKGKFIKGFIYVRALAAFVHEDEVDRFENMTAQIGPGSIIGKAVRIEDDASIGAFTEIEKGVRIKSKAAIGDNTVVRKGSVVQRGGAVKANSYVGQFSVIGPDAEVGPHAVLGRSVTMQRETLAGMQSRVGVGTHLAPGATLMDSVSVGRQSFVGEDTMVGEMTDIGNYCHFGGGSVIGDQSHFGDFVRVARNVWLVSPTHAETGAIITESNLTRFGQQ